MVAIGEYRPGLQLLSVFVGAREKRVLEERQPLPSAEVMLFPVRRGGYDVGDRVWEVMRGAVRPLTSGKGALYVASVKPPTLHGYRPAGEPLPKRR